ncbi:hypothetical protein HQ529_03455 [Candidatus Woesearchaeota archaeon]|nr:hypothetical protein [Candidatus Woesearchaeota archaeon]
MPLDILCVDDDMRELVSAMRTCIDFKLNGAFFTSGVEALKYLRNTNVLPRAYLIDMRLADITEENIEELDSPLQIFKYVKKHGDTTHFRFHTGNLSEHDEKVIQQTSAKYLIKGDDDYIEFFEFRGAQNSF